MICLQRSSHGTRQVDDALAYMNALECSPRLPRGPRVQRTDRTRCGWAGVGGTPLTLDYHDREWGVPVHDDRMLFELLVLEGAQVGLSWSTILARRHGYRRAFEYFDPSRVAAFSEARQEKLMQDPGIVRNRLKVASAIINAKRFLEVQQEYGSFDAWLWRFTEGRPVVNRHRRMIDVPVSSTLSDRISRELKQRGFQFVGSTTVYAYLQATGVINDHQVQCFRHQQLARYA